MKFRVLIIGRANSGKTSILQGVCDTTQSPAIYKRTGFDGEWIQIQLEPSVERGEHSIEDELVFSNHDGYIFHDSRGFEAGDNKELEIVQNFVRQRSGEERLASRLHAIWYCIPMDNQRPELDFKHFKDISPDRNVPVIGVFTKYDQFRRNIKMHLQNYPNENPDCNAADVADRRFQEDYLRLLDEGARFVRLERMHKPGVCCINLIEETSGALNSILPHQYSTISQTIGRSSGDKIDDYLRMYHDGRNMEIQETTWISHNHGPAPISFGDSSAGMTISNSIIKLSTGAEMSLFTQINLDPRLVFNHGLLPGPQAPYGCARGGYDGHAAYSDLPSPEGHQPRNPTLASCRLHLSESWTAMRIEESRDQEGDSGSNYDHSNTQSDASCDHGRSSVQSEQPVLSWSEQFSQSHLVIHESNPTLEGVLSPSSSGETQTPRAKL